MSDPGDYEAVMDNALARWADELGTTVEELKRPGPLAIAREIDQRAQARYMKHWNRSAERMRPVFQELARMVREGENAPRT